MPSTPVLQLPYPAATDPADVPTDMRELAERIEALHGAPDGFAALDDTGKVPEDQLPPISSTVAMPLPVQLTVPRTQTLPGNAFYTVVTPSADVDLGCWAFVKDVDGAINGQVRVPEARTAAQVGLALAQSGSVAGTTRIQVFALKVADGQTYSRPLVDLGAGDVALPATAYSRKDAYFTLGAVAAGEQVLLRIVHAGAHANDTLAQNTLLLAAWLEGV